MYNGNFQDSTCFKMSQIKILHLSGKSKALLVDMYQGQGETGTVVKNFQIRTFPGTEQISSSNLFYLSAFLFLASRVQIHLLQGLYFLTLRSLGHLPSLPDSSAFLAAAFLLNTPSTTQESALEDVAANLHVPFY